MKYINICVEEIKILDEVLDSDTVICSIGVESVLLPGFRQLPLVDLNVPHGHLQRVPLRLYQLLGRLQVK